MYPHKHLLINCISPSRILVDTGSGGSHEYTAHLKEVLSRNQITIQEIVLTHWHPDHVGGIADVLKCVRNTGNSHLVPVLVTYM